MGVVPTPPTIAVGDFPTAAQLNQYRDSINFLKDPPACYAYHAASQSPASGAWTLMAMTQEIYDNVQSGDTPAHDLATNPSRVYIRTSGKYRIGGQLNFASNAVGARQATIWKNSNGDATFATGSEIVINKQGAVSGVGTSVTLFPVKVPLVAGDYVEMFGFQSSGGPLATLTGQSVSFLTVEWAGA